jgi:hypothetical protein
VHTPDGQPFNADWPGRYLIDPTTEKGTKYIEGLFGRLVGEGYDYFKIDGQPTLAHFYRINKDNLSIVPADPDSDEAYRKTLDTIRRAIGPDRFLLGCYGTALEGIGYMDGARTGGDVGISWRGFMTALDATRSGLFLNNIAWHSDPDTLLAREPLTLDQAHAWATLYALTGQVLLTSDKMYELSPERAALLKQVMPPQRIRPVDMYRYERNPDVWALYNQNGPLVLGVFNYDLREKIIAVDPFALQPEPESDLFALYDFWGGRYLGNAEGAFSVSVPGTSCLAIVAQPVGTEPMLLASGRHVTQAPQFASVTSWDSRKRILSGRCSVIAGEPHELVIYVPSAAVAGRNVEWAVDHCRVTDAEVATQYRAPILRMRIQADRTGEVEWRVAFRTEKERRASPRTVGVPQVRALSHQAVEIGWEPVAGCDVYRVARTSPDDPEAEVVPVLVGGTALRDADVTPEHRYAYTVAAVDGDLVSEESTEIQVTVPKPPPPPPKPDMYLGDLTPVSAEQGWGELQIDKSVEGKPLTIGDQQFERGLGSHANGRIVYEIPEGACRFVALVGIDAERKDALDASVVFRVLIDDEQVFDSGVMFGSTPAMAVDVRIGEGQRLTLVMDDAGNGQSNDHADWVEAGFLREE